MSIKDLIPWNRNKKEVAATKVKEDGSFLSLHRGMNRLFEDFWNSGSLLRSPFFTETWDGLRPKADISETSNEVNISVELPGVDEKNIELNLSHGVLTIKGEKTEEREEKDGAYYRTERSYGSFYRSIPVPEWVDENSIDASFKNGVLKIRLPKTIEAKMSVKKIPVKAA